MSKSGARPVTIAASAAFLVAALAAGSILILAPRIEADIGARAMAALEAYPGVSASVSGRNVTLGGDLADEAKRDAASAAVDALPGVHSVAIDTGSPSVAAAAIYRFGAVWDGHALSLTGFMPTRDAREETVTHARDMLKGADIADATQVSPGAPDANWQDIVAACIAAMRSLASATLDIAGTQVKFTGVARNATGYAAASEILDSFPAPYVVTADIRIDANAPPLAAAAYRFSAAYDGVGIAFAGHVPSAEIAAAFAAWLRTTVPEATLDDRSTAAAGAPDGAWGDAVLTALSALAEARSATLIADGRRLTLDALARSAEARDRIWKIFADLPAAYAATLRIGLEGEAVPVEKSFGGPDTPAAACQADFETALGATPIVFASAAATLPDEAVPLIDNLAKIAGICPDARIEIAGHTDASGNAAANLRLSQGRAEAIEAALILKGVDAKRLTAHGYGAARPIADNDNDAGKARNRRIEVIVRP